MEGSWGKPGTRADGQGVPRWEALGRAVWLRPEGATGLAEGGPAPSPGQRPGLRVVFHARPEGAKAMGGALLSLLLPPLGACLQRFCLPGVTRPSAALPRAGSLQPLRGFALNAGHRRTVPVGELAIPFGTRADGQGRLDGKRLAGPYGSAPKGQPGSPKAGLLPAQGNALGCGWFSKRAPKGQKPWELRFCHCFCPLWGRACRASAYPG